jgi:hypothetical protein
VTYSTREACRIALGGDDPQRMKRAQYFALVVGLGGGSGRHLRWTREDIEHLAAAEKLRRERMTMNLRSAVDATSLARHADPGQMLVVEDGDSVLVDADHTPRVIAKARRLVTLVYLPAARWAS